MTEQGGQPRGCRPVSTPEWAALARSAPRDIQIGDGVRVERGSASRSLTDEQLGDCDHRDQCDHREPRKTVAECRSAVSNA